MRQSYRVAGEILERGAITDESRRSLRRALEDAPAAKAIFHNAMLGDQTVVHGVFEHLRRGEYHGLGVTPSAVDRWIECGMTVAGVFVLNPNHTENLISSWYSQICGYGETRDMKTIESWTPDWSASSQLKNPVGRLIAGMIIPAFRKPFKLFWEAEDSRLALLHQLDVAGATRAAAVESRYPR